MRVLLVKTSSLGDVVHTLPALTDAQRALPGITFDWVVEEAFADIAAQHPAVNRVIPCALRRWRKSLWRTWRSGEWKNFKAALRAQQYDLVLDAQGLVKSAFVTRLGRGEKVGLDKASAREPLSAWVLDRGISVARDQHAVERLRQLFARALGYGLPGEEPDYGLAAARQNESAPRTLLFCHGTTWLNKHWPEEYWRQLAERAVADGFRVALPWGSEAERERAERLANSLEGVYVLPRQGLSELVGLFRTFHGFVAVDTGLAHLAIAAGLPGVGLYGPTSAALTGLAGRDVVNLAANFPCAPCLKRECHYRGEQGREVYPPCFSTVQPDRVYQQLQSLVSGRTDAAPLFSIKADDE